MNDVSENDWLTLGKGDWMLPLSKGLRDGGNAFAATLHCTGCRRPIPSGILPMRLLAHGMALDSPLAECALFCRIACLITFGKRLQRAERVLRTRKWWAPWTWRKKHRALEYRR